MLNEHTLLAEKAVRRNETYGQYYRKLIMI